MKIFSKLSLILAGVGALIYALSFVGYIIPFVNLILFFIAVIVTLNLTLKKLELGVLILIFELILGSKGYLFSISIGDSFVLSLRMTLFVLVMTLWLIKAISKKKFTIAQTPFFYPLLAFAITVILAAGIGYYNGNPLSAMFFDANGYLYFALALPLFEVARNKDFAKRAVAVFIGGTLALSMLSLFLFADFYLTKDWARPSLTGSIATESASAQEAAAGKFNFGGIKNRLYDESGKPVEYRWQKDIGLGTISYVSGKFFRVFSSSQIWVLCAFLFFTYLLLRRWKKDRQSMWLCLAIILTGITLFVSFSRSFWVGTAGGLIFMLFFLPKKRAMLITVTAIVLLAIAIAGIYFVAPATYQTLSSRVTSIFQPEDELAGQNRLNLLEPILVKIQNRPLAGHGFGTPVIYESVVPEKQGFIKVFAYEWGYLDQIVKFGLIGMGILVWYLIEVFRNTKRAIKNTDPINKTIIVGLLIGLIGILVTHLTSPYLNHPLGIGYILFLSAITWHFTQKTSLDKNVAKPKENAN